MVISEVKRALVVNVLEVYDEIAAEFPAACSRECAACCTTKVMATSVEAALALDYLAETGQQGLLDKAFAEVSARPRQPVVSMNALAEYCLRKEEPPVSDEDPATAPCPFRGPDGCPLYPVRPLACRSMWSREKCRQGGVAIMDSLLVSITGAFQQIVEDVDRGGTYGAFVEALWALVADPSRVGTALDLTRPLPGGLVPTRANPGFIVPPEQRQQVGGYLGRLWRREVVGMPFRAALELVAKSKEDNGKD
jgi:Fe-S-cluster containining protein